VAWIPGISGPPKRFRMPLGSDSSALKKGTSHKSETVLNKTRFSNNSSIRWDMIPPGISVFGVLIPSAPCPRFGCRSVVARRAPLAVASIWDSVLRPLGIPQKTCGEDP